MNWNNLKSSINLCGALYLQKFQIIIFFQGGFTARWLERASDRSVLSPLHWRQGWHRAGHGSDGTQGLGAPGRSRHHLRPRAHRAGVQNAWDAHGQGRAGLPACHHPVQPRHPGTQVAAAGGGAARESVRCPRGLHSIDTARRAWSLRKVAATSSFAPIHRAQVSRAPLLLPTHRWRAHRLVPHWDARVAQYRLLD